MRNALLTIVLLLFLLGPSLVLAVQSTSIALQGKLTNTTTGVTIYSATLRVNVSDQSGLTVWNQTYPNAVTTGFFDLLLGNDATNPLNLTYNQDYNVSVYVGSSSIPIGGSYKFRSSVGDVSLSNLSAGNFTASGNISFGSSFFMDKTNGYVGIGTTSPLRPLHIKIGNSLVNPGLRIENDVGGFFQLIHVRSADSDVNKTYFSTQNGTIMVFNSIGNVGIGTTSPSAKFHIINNDNYEGSILLGNSPYQGAINFSGATGLFKFNNPSGGVASTKYYQFISDSNPIMTMLQDGKVGIGTTGPVDPLHINQSSGSYGLTISSVTGEPGIHLQPGSSPTGFIVANPSGLLSIESTNNISLRTNNGNRLFIDPNGNTMIGKVKSDSGATAGVEFQPDGAGFFTRSQQPSLVVLRLTDDGDLVRFYQDASLEGTISVSGTTVSYNAFTGSHIGHIINVSSPQMGMVVVVDHSLITDDGIDNQPHHYVTLTSKAEDKRVIGVLASNRSMSATDVGYSEDEYLIFALGDGVILVTDTNGNIENGDFLTTSARSGYAQRQTSDQMMEYTVAKSLANVNWDSIQIDPALGFKWKLIPATYHAG